MTGATHGIGRAAALRLARDGWEVIVHGRNAERGAEVVAVIEAEEAGEVDVLVTDVGGSWSGPTAPGSTRSSSSTFAPPTFSSPLWRRPLHHRPDPRRGRRELSTT